jgi:hypothetical protein
VSLVADLASLITLRVLSLYSFSLILSNIICSFLLFSFSEIISASFCSIALLVSIVADVVCFATSFGISPALTFT